jgi:hypothetical protein
VGRAVLDVRRTADGAVVTIGHSSLTLARSSWPEFDQLLADLSRAADRHVAAVQGRLDR